MRNTARDPKTSAQWQEAVNAAQFLLLLDSARQYGLVEGGPQKIKADRCLEILERGRKLGYRPLSHSQLIEQFLGTREAS